jgi:hypothetical protein
VWSKEHRCMFCWDLIHQLLRTSVAVSCIRCMHSTRLRPRCKSSISRSWLEQHSHLAHAGLSVAGLYEI